MTRVYRFTDNPAVRVLAFFDEVVIDKQVGLHYHVLRTLKGRKCPENQSQADQIVKEYLSMHEMNVNEVPQKEGYPSLHLPRIEKGVPFPRGGGRAASPVITQGLNLLAAEGLPGDSVVMPIGERRLAGFKTSVHNAAKKRGLVIRSAAETETSLRVWLVDRYTHV